MLWDAESGALMPDLTCLSLGGGVQSTALALMADAGLLDAGKPDVAFFADTKWEPAYVYETVEAVRQRVSFPVETVDNGRSLKQDVWDGVAANGNSFTPIPVFSDNGGMSTRQCTNQYKIVPITRAIRARLGVGRGERVNKGTVVEQWMGISVDEFGRAKPNRLGWITSRFPLIEQGLTRQDCKDYLQENHPDIPVGRSSCNGCPFHSQSYWLEMIRTRPDDWEETCAIDERLRDPDHNEVMNRNSLSYLHVSRTPLRDALRMAANTPSLFGDDQEGLCDSGHCFT